MEKSADQVNSEEDMAPRNNCDPADNSSNTNADEADLQEMAEVNENLDELTRALDFFEQRTDDIIAQLKELLHSNREIRMQMAREQELALSEATSSNEACAEPKDTTMREDDHSSQQ